MVVGRGARPWWRPSSWSGVSLACSGRRRCPAVTHGRRKTRPRGRAGGEGAWRREQDNLEVAGDVDGAWHPPGSPWRRAKPCLERQSTGQPRGAGAHGGVVRRCWLASGVDVLPGVGDNRRQPGSSLARSESSRSALGMERRHGRTALTQTVRRTWERTMVSARRRTGVEDELEEETRACSCRDARMLTC
jgi:hypothetical protein